MHSRRSVENMREFYEGHSHGPSYNSHVSPRIGGLKRSTKTRVVTKTKRDRGKQYKEPVGTRSEY